jgi:hypothetical protein
MGVWEHSQLMPRPNPRPRIAGAVVGWGALWGACLGFLLVAPLLLRSHHFPPMSPGQWLLVDGVLLGWFTALGVGLTFYSHLVFFAAVTLRSRPLRHETLAYGLATGPLLVIAYFAATVLIHWVVFRDLVTLNALRSTTGLVTFILSSVAATLAYRLLSRQSSLAALTMLRSSLILGTLLGVALLPGRSSGIQHQAPVVAASLRQVAAHMVSSRTPLLVVGIDGANWQTLAPLIAQGRLPTIAGLMRDGMSGDIESLWPPYWSAPAWAAILSGFPREDTGIFEDLAGAASGLPRFQVSLSLDPRIELLMFGERLLLSAGAVDISHMRRENLARPPFWEYLSRSGIKTAVIRFFFSFPADGQADLVISNWAGQDEFARLGVRTAATSGLAAPAEEAHHLLASFTDGHVFDRTVLLSMVGRPDWPTPRDAVVNPIELLADAIDIDQRSVDAAVALLRRHPDTRVVALYLGGNDSVSHAFWQYRFPDAFGETPPTSDDVRVLGPVIDRYWEYLDHNLARVIAEFPAMPNVLVLSDHGQESSQIRPLWKGQHSARGVFVASGPDIPAAPSRISVSYFDVAPTIFQIMGLESPSGMPGRSLITPAEK